jgi:hypothetical protein
LKPIEFFSPYLLQSKFSKIMPRYRFSWSNLDHDLLLAIAQGLSIDSDVPTTGLREKYGSRPKENFVYDGWQVLLSEWLKQDHNACSELADALRKRGLGLVEQADNYLFLQSCKNTRNLRHEALQIFLRKGEKDIGDISDAEPAGLALEASSVGVLLDKSSSSYVSPSLDDQSLKAFANEAVTQLYSVREEDIKIDCYDGILVPHGTSAVFINVIEDSDCDDAEFRIFSRLIDNPRECDDLYKFLNEINVPLMTGNVYYANETIVLEQRLYARFTTLGALKLVIEDIRDAADYYHKILQKMFGGTLILREILQDEISA